MLLSVNQIKVFVLFVLDTARCPLPLDVTNDIIAMCDVNCFNIAEALSELTDQGVIERYLFEGETYIRPVKPIGEVVESLGKEIPLSVREKATVYTMREIAKLRKNLGVTSSIRQDGENYFLTITIRDDSLQLYNAEFYSPTMEQALRMERSFKGKPYEIYGDLITKLTEIREYGS